MEDNKYMSVEPLSKKLLWSMPIRQNIRER